MTANASSEQELDNALAITFAKKHPADVARLLDASAVDGALVLLQSMDAELIVSVMEKMQPHISFKILTRLSETLAKSTVNLLNVSYLARCVGQGSEDQQKEIIALVSKPSSVAELQELMAYDQDSAGGLMDTRVMTFSPTTSVRQIRAQLKKIRKRRIHMLVVVDQEQLLLGLIPLQDVILAQSAQQLSELIKGQPPSISATATRRDIEEMITERRLLVLPVVNFEGQFLGLIRQDSVVRAVKDEALSDMQAMVGVHRDERALSPPLTSVSKRLPWLNINLLTAFLAASVVGAFEATIASVTALAVLLPVVAGQSGNTGAQALAVTMRGLALKEVQTAQWLKLAAKEAVVGAVNGAAIAVVCSVAVYFWSGSLGLSGIIAAAMILSMTIASVAGTVIPVILRRVGLDPAQSSSIILTTVTDVMGFMAFLGLATLFMRFI